ncbi:MAG: glutaredoxin family protein [candidate division NC10 bacterium]|nr:glutaredoxin family protein [candidate division NC10 bacterium]MBI4839852.1 glutaredoxin family protein [candidate division NC10 bacterium]
MNRQPLQLELYSRPGCHLCDELRAVCQRLSDEFLLRVTEVNIEAHPALEERFGREIPVLFIDGRKTVKFRTTETELRRKLRRRLLSRRLFGC